MSQEEEDWEDVNVDAAIQQEPAPGEGEDTDQLPEFPEEEGNGHDDVAYGNIDVEASAQPDGASAGGGQSKLSSQPARSSPAAPRPSSSGKKSGASSQSSAPAASSSSSAAAAAKKKPSGRSKEDVQVDLQHRHSCLIASLTHLRQLSNVCCDAALKSAATAALTGGLMMAADERVELASGDVLPSLSLLRKLVDKVAFYLTPVAHAALLTARPSLVAFWASALAVEPKASLPDGADPADEEAFHAARDVFLGSPFCGERPTDAAALMGVLGRKALSKEASPLQIVLLCGALLRGLGFRVRVMHAPSLLSFAALAELRGFASERRRTVGKGWWRTLRLPVTASLPATSFGVVSSSSSSSSGGAMGKGEGPSAAAAPHTPASRASPSSLRGQVIDIADSSDSDNDDDDDDEEEELVVVRRSAPAGSGRSSLVAAGVSAAAATANADDDDDADDPRVSSSKRRRTTESPAAATALARFASSSSAAAASSTNGPSSGKKAAPASRAPAASSSAAAEADGAIILLDDDEEEGEGDVVRPTRHGTSSSSSSAAASGTKRPRKSRGYTRSKGAASSSSAAREGAAGGASSDGWGRMSLATLRKAQGLVYWLEVLTLAPDKAAGEAAAGSTQNKQQAQSSGSSGKKRKSSGDAPASSSSSSSAREEMKPRWVMVDPVRQWIDCPSAQDTLRPRTHPLEYVFGCEADGTMLDLIKRYSVSWAKISASRIQHGMDVDASLARTDAFAAIRGAAAAAKASGKSSPSKGGWKAPQWGARSGVSGYRPTRTTDPPPQHPETLLQHALRCVSSRGVGAVQGKRVAAPAPASAAAALSASSSPMAKLVASVLAALAAYSDSVPPASSSSAAASSSSATKLLQAPSSSSKTQTPSSSSAATASPLKARTVSTPKAQAVSPRKARVASPVAIVSDTSDIVECFSDAEAGVHGASAAGNGGAVAPGRGSLGSGSHSSQPHGSSSQPHVSSSSSQAFAPAAIQQAEEEELSSAAAAGASSIPSSAAGFKNHPLYVLEKDLRGDEVLDAGDSAWRSSSSSAGPKPPVLGLHRGTPFYARSAVSKCLSEEGWLKAPGGPRGIRKGELGRPALRVAKRVAKAEPGRGGRGGARGGGWGRGRVLGGARAGDDDESGDDDSYAVGGRWDEKDDDDDDDDGDDNDDDEGAGNATAASSSSAKKGSSSSSGKGRGKAMYPGGLSAAAAAATDAAVLALGGDVEGDASSTQVFLYAPWQTEPYHPPRFTGGPIPRSKFGTFQLWGNDMALLPEGLSRLRQPSAKAACKKLGVECVDCLVGFDRVHGRPIPRLDGIVVAAVHEEAVMAAAEVAEQVSIENQIHKSNKRAIASWKKLVNAALVRVRLQKEYGKDAPEDANNSSSF